MTPAGCSRISCALRGAPDAAGPGMDWITTCAAQAGIYPLRATVDADAADRNRAERLRANFGNNVCQPGKPSPEVCNHLDDDCDGQVDNLTGTCMTQAPGGCNVTGHNACGSTPTGYGQICQITAGVDYCTACGQTVKGASCGQCFGSPCTSGPANCPPNYICPVPSNGCQAQPGCTTSVQCWLPADLSYDRSKGCFAPNPPPPK